ncbi:sensor histidine kinase [Thiocapsa marina]|uniref:histidine kinase n=1 Tax=Thiocapsa marina 5811 TaxID=768671 RepID=F9UBZ6_9GAMM|nr:ATP-binding protein [Thiocapsa marina]EGV18464.1 integral membrane sensor signal transduction histidine kinase [Thiocapsa marina 5811]
MTLRRRAQLIALVSALIFLALLTVLVVSHRDWSQSARNLALTNALSLEIVQLRTALFGYLLQPAEQPRALVDAQFENISELLTPEALSVAAMIRRNERTRHAWEEVRRLADEMRTLIADLVSSGREPRFAERDERTTNLIVVNSHNLILLMGQIQFQANARMLSASKRTNLALGLLLVGVSGLGFGIFLTLQRTILNPVQALREAALRVSRGALDQRMRSPRRDELGDLADAFDAMLDRLQETTVSRARLETEIVERQRAQAEIQRLNAGLEERVRRRTAELSAANQELESFAYAVSHDLRAPLRALSGFSQALMEDYGERLDGEALDDLQQIDIASRRMGELIDGILTLSRSTRGELRREPVDLSALARHRLEELAAAEPQRLVAREVEPGMVVPGDPTMLEAVMVNLIDNAWKYTGRTHDAIIRVYSMEREGKRWSCVTDNGAGFDMAYSERLFKAFQRLHRQEEFVGIGIGLATVQRIVHRHGGVVVAEGAPGQGATFRFTLPAAASEEPTG